MTHSTTKFLYLSQRKSFQIATLHNKSDLYENDVSLVTFPQI